MGQPKTDYGLPIHDDLKPKIMSFSFAWYVQCLHCDYEIMVKSVRRKRTHLIPKQHTMHHRNSRGEALQDTFKFWNEPYLLHLVNDC